jgi:GT2 family glycosyltransferase
MNKNSISIVIPTYNGLQYLQANLPLVLLACPNCEIIVVDDASTDDTSAWLKKNYPKIAIVCNDKNSGFAISVNKGVKKATNPLVLILNNDVAPEKGFIKPLLEIISKENIFSVGSLEISENQGKRTTSGKSWFKIKNGMLLHGKCRSQTSGETAWTQGGSMLVKKDVFQKLGGFNPIYSPGYWEDIDLGWRAKQAGYINWFCADSKVKHNHGSTFDSLYRKSQIELLSYRNSFLFVWKNFKTKDFLISLFWLPYNLLFLGVKTRGVYVIAFFQALTRLITFFVKE